MSKALGDFNKVLVLMIQDHLCFMQNGNFEPDENDLVFAGKLHQIVESYNQIYGENDE